MDKRQTISCAMLNVLIPWLPIVRVPGSAGVIGGVLVDEWKDAGKASVTDGLARYWKDIYIYILHILERYMMSKLHSLNQMIELHGFLNGPTNMLAVSPSTLPLCPEMLSDRIRHSHLDGQAVPL